MMPPLAGAASPVQLNHLVSNTVAQLIAPLARMAFGLALMAAVARYLGVQGFGSYALIFAYVAVFSGVFNDWGVGTICLREMAQRPADRVRLISGAASLQSLIALTSYLLMLSSLFFLHYPGSVVAGIAIYGLVILLSPLDILALTFQADLRMASLVGPSLLGVSLNFVLGMAAVILHGALPALVLAALASLLAQYAWVTFLSLQVLGRSIRPSTYRWLQFLRQAWPLGIASTLNTCLQQAPVLALSLFSLEALGLFNAANKVPQLLMLIPLALHGTTFPLLSAAWSTDRSRFRRLVEILISGGLLFGLVTTIVGILVAGPLMGLLFGPAFHKAAVPFALLISTSGLMFSGILAGEALVAAGLQRFNLAILAAGLPLLLMLLFVLIPAAGAAGAALALLTSYAMIVLAAFVVARARLGLSVPGLAGPGALRRLWSFRPLALGGSSWG